MVRGSSAGGGSRWGFPNSTSGPFYSGSHKLRGWKRSEASAPKFTATSAWCSPGSELPVPSPGIVTGARDRHAGSTGAQSGGGSGSHSFGVDTLCGEAHDVSGPTHPVPGRCALVQ